MSRIFLHIIFILFASSFLSGCIRTLDEKDMPKIEPKLVIGGYISPQDTLIKIIVGKSVPIYKKNDQWYNLNPPVKDASVLLSGNGVSVSLLYDERSSSYTVPASQFTIVPGTTYHLTVSTPAGLYAEAETTVPENINSSLTYKIDTVEVTSNNYGYSGKSIQVSVWWDDIQQHNNYYRIYGEIVVLYDSTYYNYPMYNYHYDLNFDTKNIVIKDIGYANGKFGPFKADTPLQSKRFNDIRLSLLNTDRNYYEFYRSYDSNYQDDPFSEPQNIYTNIKGGLGVFASYQKYTIKTDLK
ncbi:MAG: DUF4249 domain-containing protein [Sporocytophaga sp.]|uniref:DUF4249 domain-containing protein n=1 Tax=Sporocytophaga sp. TaxID=2231183 RepID=UPI001B1F9E65|nr:DUF4249 domain-containing protein [Sporocytophaga sp.]MBO9703267.1 DUF4249 domain-containing protein [Sporocytophaga sp.]